MTKSVTYLGDNKFWIQSVADLSISLCYGDCIYESLDFEWVGLAYEKLIENGILIVQTDWHTQHLYKNHLEELGMYFVNHLVWKNEWGNHPKNRFHQCYDDILIYSKGKNWKFYSDRIQVPKATANTKLNPSGRMTKTATAWIDDITLTTTSKERVKLSSGKNIRWQKPLKLYDRIILPFTDISDNILDPFMGSGSLAKWSKQNERNYFGIENDEEVYRIALENLAY
jgi:DNA modification methylase